MSIQCKLLAFDRNANACARSEQIAGSRGNIGNFHVLQSEHTFVQACGSVLPKSELDDCVASLSIRWKNTMHMRRVHRISVGPSTRDSINKSNRLHGQWAMR